MINKSRMNWRLPVVHLLRQSMQETPLVEVENTITLRVLVLALVVVGIIATDIAAETKFSLWAVPLSIVGAIWSYQRRRERNVSVKFCIAIGMLAALGAFFGRLFGELNDTRLALAELLIQLQVLHSFDTPRRKDLGYSIVIGLILLGVAATLSQTLAFAPVLLLFLAIALPTLVLDYRSRLGFQKLVSFPGSTREQQKTTLLNWKFLFFNFLIVVVAGLSIFAVLPRVPGYQLRMFPVSAPIDVKGEFTGRSIVNPGYIRRGNEQKNRGAVSNSSGLGENQPGAPGKLNDNFYYGFSSQINQNLRGEMKPKVVMRVRSQSPGFWRVLGFDRYTGKGWEISRTEQLETVKRPPWSFQIFLPRAVFGGQSKDIVQTYTVVSDLPNLIPAMAHPKEIYFPTPMVAVDKEGGLRAPVELSEGLTYTVVSEVPQRDRTLLRTAATKYSESIKKYYLQIPDGIADKIKKHTEGILANYNLERVGKSQKVLESPYEIALYLAQYLKQHYTFPDSPFGLPYLSEKEDLVEAFLFEHKGGYPDHFSTVLTVMLRSIGIPARLVAGFSPGEFNPFTGMYVVRNTDAYAMTEVYFPQYGWYAFDPIPNHPLIPPSVEDTETFGVLHQFWNWVAGWLPTPLKGFLNTVFGTIFNWIFKALSWFISLFSQGWAGAIAGLTIGTAFAFCSWMAWRLWRQWRYRWKLRKLPPMESLYQQMLRWTARKGLGKHPAQTPLEFARISYDHHSSGIAEVIDEICQAYVSWRYGGYAPDLNRLQQRWRELNKTPR
ncbi:DUF3488 and DUF4129 domain-containing transglutaminase family protein [Scytonema sp. NUACC26]